MKGIYDYLNFRERHILSALLGGNSRAEVGNAYGVTKERVRQVERKALRKIVFKFSEEEKK